MAQSNNNNPKRRQTFVDSHVQGALLRRIFIHWVTFYFVAVGTIITMLILMGDPKISVSERVASQSGQIILIGIVMLSLLPAFFLDTVRMSNRFVGPIARLRRNLRDLGEKGDSEEIKFRDNDFWAEAADEYNVVRHRILDQAREIEELKSNLNSNKPLGV